MKKEILCCIIFGGVIGVASLSSAKYHTKEYSPEFKDVSCAICHINGMGPVLKKPCLDCHNKTGGDYSDYEAPEMKSHSSVNIGSETYGEWSYECVDCHHPHELNGFDRDVGIPAEYILADFVGNQAVTKDSKTTLVLEEITAYDPDWADPATWAAKTGPDRGLTFLFLLRGRYKTFTVDSMTDTTITFDNAFTYFGPRMTVFGQLIYGQLIDDEINENQVVFTGPKGMAYNEEYFETDITPDGICQVCHTKTKYWRSDGTLTDHYNGSACNQCHDHSEGFKPNCNGCHGTPPTNDTTGQGGLVSTPSPTGSTSSGAHALHVQEYDYTCATCHQGGMPDSAIVDDYKIQMGFDTFSFKGDGSIYHAQELSSSYDYQGTNGTVIDATAIGTATSCENIYCHSDGTAVSTSFFDPSTFPGPSQISPVWNGSTTCDSCHAYGPDYPHLSPKLNAHERHLSFFYAGGINENANPCHVCHKTSSPDGISTNPEFHANGQYDVVPDGDYVFKVNLQPESQSPVSFDYQFDAGRSTCSNISCHQDARFGENFSWGYGSVSASPHTMRPGDECGEVEFGISVSGAYPLHSVALPVTYYIDWGDGSEPLEETVNSSSSPVYSYIYADPSINYDVRWTVRDAKRLTLTSADMHKTHTVTPYSGNAYPTVDFTVSVDGYTVTLTDQSYDLDYNTCGHEGPGSVRIAWGDGDTEIYELDLTDTPSGQQFSHTYPVRSYTRRISYGVYDNVITYPVFVYENVPVPQN